MIVDRGAMVDDASVELCSIDAAVVDEISESGLVDEASLVVVVDSGWAVETITLPVEPSRVVGSVELESITCFVVVIGWSLVTIVSLFVVPWSISFESFVGRLLVTTSFVVVVDVDSLMGVIELFSMVD